MGENKNAPVQEQDLNELLKVRREKLSAMKESGNDPFIKTKYDVTANANEIKADYAGFENKDVSLAGRIIARRIMGKASFVTLRDGYGDIQLYVKRDDVGEEIYAAFKKWDIGDIIGVKGFVFKTQTGEISSHLFLCLKSSMVLRITTFASARDTLTLLLIQTLSATLKSVQNLSSLCVITLIIWITPRLKPLYLTPSLAVPLQDHL